MDLKVCYYKDLIDAKLDKQIVAFFVSLGYTWYAQGYNLEEDEREIVFDGPIKHSQSYTP